MRRFSGKVCLVSGALGGIGAATVRRFAAEGAKLLLTDVNRTAADVPSDLLAGAPEWSFHPADLRQPEQVAGLFSALMERFGRLDVLVNIAGYDHDSGKSLAQIDAERFQDNLDTNLASCFFCCQAAIPLMQQQKQGSIVNMSSLTWRGSAMQFSYAAAKGGVYALTRSLALAFGREGIRVNGVAPALIEVDAIVRQLPADMWQQIRTGVAAGYPLGRLGRPEEVASAIAFLASEDAAFITGQILEVSGGARL